MVTIMKTRRLGPEEYRPYNKYIIKIVIRSYIQYCTHFQN